PRLHEGHTGQLLVPAGLSGVLSINGG
ncbi:MAG: hypothetical protein QOE59_3639, partial [Actinomycetota bacterium]|nr:hypothetical protein [Actinomycetota bacterium]